MSRDVTIDIDALADSLGLTVPALKRRLQEHAAARLANEASRIAQGEIWDDESQPRTRLLDYTVEHRHLVAAAHSLL